MTKELILTPLVPDDAPDLFRLIDNNRPALRKFWWESVTQSSIDSERFIAEARKQERENHALNRGIRVDGALIGIGSIHRMQQPGDSGVLGYWLDREQGGNGYATETARQLVNTAFTALDLNRLMINACVDNYASCKVAEKTGFRLTGVDAHAPWIRRTDIDVTDVAHYVLERSEENS